MKRESKVFSASMILWLVLALVAATGCSTAVSVRHLVPAEVNMSEYRALAVASVEPYSFGFFDRPDSVIDDHSGSSGYRVLSGFGVFTEDQIAQYATKRLTTTLKDTDYFSILPPIQTDRILRNKNFGISSAEEFRRNGIEALFSSRITHMDIDEYIYANESKEWVSKDPVTGLPVTPYEITVKKYYIKQKVALVFVYEITDVDTGRTILSKNFSVQDDRLTQLKYESTTTYISAPPIEPLLERMFDSFQSEIANQLAPRWERSSIYLMSNKPESVNAKLAWDEAKRGNLAVARDVFLSEWERNQHIPSGYNAAVVIESLGDLESAMDLMKQVYQASGSSNVYDEWQRMRRALENQLKAQSQL
ncbi:MAG: hypothetical protein AB9828_11005 [Sphaerochaetaceae bacterium]